MEELFLLGVEYVEVVVVGVVVDGEVECGVCVLYYVVVDCYVVFVFDVGDGGVVGVFLCCFLVVDVVVVGDDCEVVCVGFVVC